MKLTNKQYDTAKFAVTIVAPAAITLITGLGTLYGVDTAVITGTLALVTAFAGTILGISSAKYQENKEE